MCNTSSAGVPTSTTKIVAGRLALIAMMANAHAPCPDDADITAMACVLQRPTEGRAQGVILLRPVPAVELAGAFAAKQNDGLPRSRTGTDFVFGLHRSRRRSACELQSGRVSHLAVHLGPQQSPGPVNPAFQSAYGAAGRLSGFFIVNRRPNGNPPESGLFD